MFNTLKDIYFPVLPKVVTKGYEPVLLEIRPTFFSTSLQEEGFCNFWSL